MINNKIASFRIILFVLLPCIFTLNYRQAASQTNHVGMRQTDAIIHFDKSLGNFRLLNGVNGGPMDYGNQQAPLEKYHAEAHFPQTRLHDANWPHSDCVDIPAIFPIFEADPDDPRNYNFEKTDEYIAAIVKEGSEIIYRLGVSIEHRTRHHIYPPADYNKWARICINIIRHYNEGWKNGFHYNIRYWEIWNEPEGRKMWLGTQLQYLQLYETASKAIKAYNPALKIGGPAATHITSELVQPFLAYCRDHKLPLDFFSWHCYTSNPYQLAADARLARKLLDEYGYPKAESHLNEWYYLEAWRPLFPGTTEDLQQYETVGQSLAYSVGPKGAVYAASVLMLMQEASVDVANFFAADYNPLSMFDFYGVPTKVYYVFKAFDSLARNSVRVSCKQQIPDSSIVLAAAYTASNKKGSILISSNLTDFRKYTIQVNHFPAKGKRKLQMLVVDKHSNLELRKEWVIQETENEIQLELPPLSVCLITLTATSLDKE
jgi:hypothetical protein